MILGGRKDPRVADALIAAMKDSNFAVRSLAGHALFAIGDPRAVELLIASLKDSNPVVRQEAARGLGDIKDPRAVEPLIAALKDSVSAVSADAAGALGAINDPRAVDPLIAVLQDSHPDGSASGLAASRRYSRAAAALDRANADKAYDRAVVAAALGDIADPRAVEPLIAALNDPDSSVSDHAAVALGDIGDPRAVKPLIDALDSNVRSKATEALEKIGPSAVEPLVAALHDANPIVREGAVRALGYIKDPRAVDPLRRLTLKDPNPGVHARLRPKRWVTTVTHALANASTYGIS